MFTIDSHHHFWNPDEGDYSWMTDAHASICKIFGPSDFRPALKAAGISKTILVQTWSSQEETERFLALADETEFIAGVVGWVDLTAIDLGMRLDALLGRPGGKWLVGIRHQVHDEADDRWLLRSDVGRGFEALAERDLAYDLLIRPRELKSSLETVARHRGLRFVIDHIAKPDIRAGGTDGWRDGLARLAEHREHVWVKLSGMVTEADWADWRPEQIRPYIETVVDLFGPDRCMLGSDWPVCTLAADYGTTVDLVRGAIAARSDADRQAILSGSAVSAYRLEGRL